MQAKVQEEKMGESKEREESTQKVSLRHALAQLEKTCCDWSTYAAYDFLL